MQPNQDQSEVESSDTIFFMSFLIQKNPEDGNSIVTLLNKKESEGKLKPSAKPVQMTDNYLLFRFTAGNKILDSLIIEHPLYKRFEYLNGNNQFETKDTLVNEAEFFIRFQVKQEMNEIKIYEHLKNKGPRELTSIKL